MTATATPYHFLRPVRTQSSPASPRQVTALLLVGLGLALVFAVIFAPAMPFIVDGGIYLDMARAITADGSLAISGNGGVEGAPTLTKYLTRDVDGLSYPQYPSGYAFIAAPFYALFGIRGLMLMNALALFASTILVFRIAMQLFKDEATSLGAVLIFLFSTFVSNYAVAVWPHMLSLACWLGAIFCALSAHDASSERSRTLLFCAAGLMIGVGVNIRVDSILIFAVLLVWLKLFARPSDRLAPLWLTLGMAPLLLFAAWLNQIKFGVFSPFSYGSSGGATDIHRYRAVIIGGGIILAGLWLANIPSLASTAHRKFGARKIILASIIGVVAALIFVGPFIWKTLYGVYVLVINLQAHDAYFQRGVEPNEFGQLMFWGYPKKALVQSLPFLPLILIPITTFLHGKNVVSISLCLLAICAPITFYALNQWHGGGSYNMRYFIPALPFIAILTASALRDIITNAGGVNRRDLLIAAVLGAILFMGAQEVGRASDILYAPAALFPQWGIALACCVLTMIYLWRPTWTNNARATLLISTLALVYAAFLGLENESSHEKARAELLALSQKISHSIPSGALTLTQLPILLIHAEVKGALVMVPTEYNINAAVRAANAFAKSGRCVYFHNSMVSALLIPHFPAGALDPTPLWAGPGASPKDPRLAFFTLTSQKSQCAF
ncbi:MAG: hypothetical protein GXP04_13410 [Alphaproteobacteria bacterium]|nr:hypothetical protein [Alphaproteobacteria bacterium]